MAKLRSRRIEPFDFRSAVWNDREWVNHQPNILSDRPRLEHSSREIMGEFGLVDVCSGWAGGEWLRPIPIKIVESRGEKALGEDFADPASLISKARESDWVVALEEFGELVNGSNES